MDNEKKYREQKITDLLSNMQSIFFDLAILWEKEEFHNFNNDENHLEHKYDLEDQFQNKALILYNLCIVHFESLGLQEYLKDFKNQIETRLENKESLIEGKFSNLDTLPYSITISVFWKFLIPFEFSQKREPSGLFYLENILKSTSIIIKELKIEPNSETKIYNSVKFVLKTAFPDIINSASEPFYKLAKCYKPDILIADLNTAIEYKFAKDEQTLVKTIDEILIDVQGYSNHPIFKFFYAVFYVKIGVCSEERFHLIWNQRHFPNNWKPIFILGH